MALCLGACGQAPPPAALAPPALAPSVSVPGPSGLPATATDPFDDWGSLTPGPFAVGYETDYLHDPARMAISRTGSGRPTPRPILWARWYPAAPQSGTPMRRVDYFKVPPQLGTEDRAFARQLEGHVRGVLAETVYRAPDQPGQDAWHLLDEPRREALRQLLERPSPARRNARSVAGRFPAVVYHTGAGGGFEDNVRLAEYLASHGYIVVTSAFASDHYIDPSTGWTEFHESFADLQLLWRALLELETVDAEKIALMGHSMGAQTIYSYAMRYRGPAALVSLDTTFENHPLAERDEITVESFFSDTGAVQIPVANYYSNTDPDLSFVNQLVAAPRDLVSIPEFDHEDFTDHGGILRASLEKRGDIRNKYEAMCQEVEHFLGRHLLGRHIAPPPRGLERTQLPAEPRFGRDLQVTITTLLEAGPDSVREVMDPFCKKGPMSCQMILPPLLDQLSLLGQTQVVAAMIDYVQHSPLRAQIDSWYFRQSAGRIAMRSQRWSEAAQHFALAIAILKRDPFDSPVHQAHFLRIFEEQRKTALERAGAGEH